MAAGEQLRGHRQPGRQLRLEQHRGLLRHAVRDRLRPVREVRPRLHRPRGAREDREQAASPEGHVRVERRRRREDLRVDVRTTDEHYKYIDLPLSNYASASFDKIIAQAARSSARRCSPATATTSARCCRSASSIRTSSSAREVTLVWGEEGRRHEEDHGRAPQAARDSRDREPGAVLEGRARDVRRGLAHRQRAVKLSLKRAVSRHDVAITGRLSHDSRARRLLFCVAGECEVMVAQEP